MYIVRSIIRTALVHGWDGHIFFFNTILNFPPPPLCQTLAHAALDDVVVTSVVFPDGYAITRRRFVKSIPYVIRWL